MLNKTLTVAMACLAATFALHACSDDDDDTSAATADTSTTDDTTTTNGWAAVTAEPETWDGTKRADITYQLLVYSFADTDGDDYGDIAGVTAHLDYIDQLGASAIWLSPIHPCMSYHGYDVTDYTSLNEDLGTDADFDELITAAHERGIKVYLDYVMNHTGSDHSWFVAAKKSTTSEYREYYSFSQDPETDIANGNIDMIASEGSAGYSSDEWFAVDETDAVEGIFTFTLDWTTSTPTVTVVECADGTTADADNETEGDDDRYLYYGDAVCKRFYDNGDGTYSLTVDFSSTWGFLIRTSTTSWTSGTKYGAASSSTTLTLGEAFTLNSSVAANIVFSTMELGWYYHSAFSTSSFADINYGPVDDLASSPAYAEMVSAAKGWLDRGVDGFRLDAVKHIYHNATSDENPTFLKTFYDEMNAYYQSLGNTDDLYMVGEVLDGSSTVAPYYAGLPALFEFDFWYRLYWAINNNTGRYFASDIMSYQQLYASYRTDYIEATKLSNHDEERTATTLGKSLDKEKAAACVLLTSAGAPYIYYGEELGLYGTQSSGDEYVRGPMLWGDGTEAYYTDKVSNSGIDDVATQQADTASLLSTYLTFTQLRNTYPALAQGTMSEHATYNSDNEDYNAVAAWYMTKDTQQMLVIHNFGTTDASLTLTDDIDCAVAVNGSVRQKITSDTERTVKIGQYGCVVYLLK